jgi:2OG-Fe(II) oxygenase superfamily
MITTVVLSLGLRRFRRFSLPCEQGCRDIRPAGGGPPPSADQRVSTGAGIGWHRDKTQFDEVVGVSLLAPCVLRFHRKAAKTWDRVSLAVEPCSAYLLSGAARTVWEHSIPALDELRYSITLRTLVAKAPSGEEGT